MLKRYVANPDSQKRLQAAKDYVRKLYATNDDYLFGKPYDPADDHRAYFTDMYSILGLLRVMSLPASSKILEIGCGPGWITEILASLGYHVTAIDPAEDFIDVAKRRLAALGTHHRIIGSVEFQCVSAEDFLSSDVFDGVIFYATLHHIANEVEALGKVYQALKPGGVLGISEGAWIPGGEIEQIADQEMATFGTLESPFTTEYIDALLKLLGYIGIARYYQIDGFYPVEQGDMSIRQAAQMKAETYNNITALKSWPWPTSLDSDVDGRVDVTGEGIKLTNTGRAAWLNRPYARGWVTLAALHGEIELGRMRLPKVVMPRESIILNNEYPSATEFGLVNEGMRWFGKKMKTS